MKEQYINFIGKIIKFGILALIFIIPILFIPLANTPNEERIFAEFNKQIVFVVGSTLLFTLWALKMVLEKKVTIVRTPIDIPLIAFLLIYILSTIFSVDLFVSVAGFYGVFHPSLISVFALALFYFTTVSNLDSKFRFWALSAIVASIGLISVVNILNYFGVFLLPYEASKLREWLPLLSLGSFAFISAITIPLSIGLSLQTKIMWLRVIGLIVSLILFTSLLIVNALGAWLALLAAVATFLILGPKVSLNKHDRLSLAVTGAIAIIFIVISFTPTLRSNIIEPLIQGENNSPTLNTEPRLSLEGSWRVATSTIGRRPILGFGPATFPYEFTRFSPVSLNQTEDWNIRFEQASNEYVNIVTTTGILGLVAFLLLLFFTLKPLTLFVTRSNTLKDNPLLVFLLSAIVAYIVGSLFFDTTLVSGLLFFLIVASSFSLLKDLGAKGIDFVSLRLVSLNAGAIRAFPDEKVPSNSILGIIFFVPALIILALTGYFGQLAYRAEVGYQRSIIAAAENKGSETRDLLISAIRTFGYRDIYHRTLSLVDLRIAQGISQQGQSDQNTQNIQSLVQEAIDQGKIASGYQNPTTAGTSSENVVNWESLAIVYSSLIGVAQNANTHSVNTYLGAIQRFPRNPLLYESLGNIYLRTNQTDLAVRTLETAVSFKGDLASTHYSLSQAYKQAGDRDEDVERELQNSLNFLPEGPNKNRVQSELDELKKGLDQDSTTATSSANKNQ